MLGFTPTSALRGVLPKWLSVGFKKGRFSRAGWGEAFQPISPVFQAWGYTACDWAVQSPHTHYGPEEQVRDP